ncbi:unnamed protein product [Boreogadus saida]
METGKLRTLLFLEINVFILSTFPLCLQGQSTEHVIDLLAALNMSQPIKGISKIHDEDPSGSAAAYKLRPKAPHLTLPPEYSRLLAAAGPASLGVHLVARQAHDSSATLLSFSSRSSSPPLLQLVSSTRDGSLRLDRGVGGGGPGAAGGLLSLLLPGGNPFSGARWARLALGLEPGGVRLFVDCEEAVVVRRRREEGVDLRAFPRDLRVTLGSAMGDSDSKFSGYLKTAEISLKAYGRRPWHCPNITDGPPPPSPAAQPTPPAPGRDPLDDRGPQRLQEDAPQRGAALGPPGPPQQGGGRPASPPPPPQEERLTGLERRLEQMAVLLDAVQAQNTDLRSRVHYLEGCECVRRRTCTWEGREVEEGHRWQTLSNTACTCTSGRVACEAIAVASFQTAALALDPCMSSPCQNGGLCLPLTSNLSNEFRCSCPPNTKGPACQRQQREACWEPRPEKVCEGRRSSQHRWAFNPVSALCEVFLFCSGSSRNNFPSHSACRDQCMLGACCVRKPKPKHPLTGQEVDSWPIKRNVSNAIPSESAEGNCDEDAHFLYTCTYLSRPRCRALVKGLPGGAAVVSFSPGEKCSEVGCGDGCACLSARQSQHPGRYSQRLARGCVEGVCAPAAGGGGGGGNGDFVCAHATRRKEIRDLTGKEVKLYQRAVRRLHAKPATWGDFVQLRAEFSPQAGGHADFLPWHRYFLRLLERELQSLSPCQLAVPYFEWTVDSGSMATSEAWRAGLFGGDGEPGSDCVRQHPFSGGGAGRSRWSPCLRRRFNASVWLPDAVDFQMALNLDDFKLFSGALQTFSGLFRLWVGGHMGSPLAAYDPLYLSHMAFMDKIWSQWQERHQRVGGAGPGGDDRGRRDAPYPAPHRHTRMKPFDVAPDAVLSSPAQLCVVYVPITIGAPCNVTPARTSPHATRPVDGGTESDDPPRDEKRGFGKRDADRDRAVRGGGGALDGFGFDGEGYDRRGYDRGGWDRAGFGRDGFNRDFLDRDGHNVFGYNRYGLNRANVSWFAERPDGGQPTRKGKREEGDEEDPRGEETIDYRTEAEAWQVPLEHFGDGGFSARGFDPLGLDSGGFDAFGFRADGYDKDDCNWFFGGPHYLRFYFHTQRQLLESGAEALGRVPRTCPPVSPLPPHWAAQDWMSPAAAAAAAAAAAQASRRAPIGRPREEGAGRKDAYGDGSIAAAAAPDRSDLWLPITPDDRMCFELHWFSGCPLGSGPITCPDLCGHARCHGYPGAICHMHNCGSCFTEWQDPATGNHVECDGW